MIHEASVHGISIPSVDEMVQAMSCSAVSKSQVSRLFTDRRRARAGVPEPAIEGDWPYLRLDDADAAREQLGDVADQLRSRVPRLNRPNG